MNDQTLYLTLATIYMLFALTLIGWTSFTAVTHRSSRRRADAYRVLRLVATLGTAAAALLLGLARTGVL